MKLRDFLSEQQISKEPEILAIYGRDWNSHYKAHPSCVIFVETTEQVQKLVHYAREKKTSLVPSGGRTGLSGGATATQQEMIVSFERMNKILNFNPIDRILTCQAGTITEEIQNFAKTKNIYFPVDFASKGSSHIGGNVATNAGGMKVIRYGLIRQWITGLQVVTGKGDVLHLNNSLVKNATGYDLRHLFIGSEGTLGFITEVSCQLTKPFCSLQVLVLSLPTLDSLMKVFEAFRVFDLTAFEMFSQKALQITLKSLKIKNPLSSQTPYYVLIEIEAPPQKHLLEVFEHCLSKGWTLGGEMSQNQQQFRTLWSLREGVSEALAFLQPYKNDVSVKISDIPDFLKKANELLYKNYPDFEVLWFGHIGDGNLHINILKPPSLDLKEFLKTCKKTDELLFSVLKDYKGSISAEHGVGLLKKDFLSFTRSKEEIEIMKSIKSVFDPSGILNPGKIF